MSTLLTDLLCPVHSQLDANGHLELFDNCVACIRVQRDELLTDLAGANGVLAMTVARLGGLVEGNPTHRINFLQRIDALRKTEKTALEALACLVNLSQHPLFHEQTELPAWTDCIAEADAVIQKARCGL